MGVATPWPKGAMTPPPPPPPPYNLGTKIFFYTFWRILCIELPHLPLHLSISLIKFLLLKLKNCWG